MATTDPQLIIDQIDIQVLSLLTGGAVSSYSIDGRALTRFSLDQLRALKEFYLNQQSASQGGARTLAEFRRPQ